MKQMPCYYILSSKLIKRHLCKMKSVVSVKMEHKLNKNVIIFFWRSVSREITLQYYLGYYFSFPIERFIASYAITSLVLFHRSINHLLRKLIKDVEKTLVLLKRSHNFCHKTKSRNIGNFLLSLSLYIYM